MNEEDVERLARRWAANKGVEFDELSEEEQDQLRMLVRKVAGRGPFGRPGSGGPMAWVPGGRDPFGILDPPDPGRTKAAAGGSPRGSGGTEGSGNSGDTQGSGNPDGSKD